MESNHRPSSFLLPAATIFGLYSRRCFGKTNQIDFLPLKKQQKCLKHKSQLTLLARFFFSRSQFGIEASFLPYSNSVSASAAKGEVGGWRVAGGGGARLHR